MTTTNNQELNSDLQALRMSVSIDDTRDLDRRRAGRASAADFNETRYLDTRPSQRMTATWGN